MSLWAIVPVKPLRSGKSRLAGELSEEERAFLNYTLLERTLKTLTAVPAISQVLVISRDTAALALARDTGARTVLEDSNSELNLALQRASVVAMYYSARSLLVLPADLPLINASSVQKLIDRAVKPPEIVIAPDRRREGTNALLINPAGLIGFAYGPGSFAKHVEQAQKYRVRVEVFEDETFGLDLDTPEDLELLRSMDAIQVTK